MGHQDIISSGGWGGGDHGGHGPRTLLIKSSLEFLSLKYRFRSRMHFTAEAHCVVWMLMYRRSNRANEHMGQMFACIGHRNYRCMHMNISQTAISAAVVPSVLLGKFKWEEKLVGWLNCIASLFTIRQSTFSCLFYLPSLQIPYWSKRLWNFNKSLFIAFFFISSLQWQLLLLLRGEIPCRGSHQTRSPDRFTRSSPSDSLQLRRFKGLSANRGPRP